MRFIAHKLNKSTSFQAFMEMARPLDNRLQPGYEVFVVRDKETGRIKEDEARYVLGVAKGEKEKKLFYSDGRPVQFKKDLNLEKALQMLKDKGYEKLGHKKISQGTATYAGGKKHKSGVVEQWQGTVYHGTNDIDFFGTTYNSSDLGHGSHLQSLNDGDAMSVTPNIEVAKDFAFDSGESIGMIIEFEADLNLYYASIDEDDLDEIDLPDGAQAVAIPYGQYAEDEFAVTMWDSPEMLQAVAVHLPLDGSSSPKTKRYQASASTAEYHGFWRAYAGEWLKDIYGGDVDRMVYDYGDNPMDAKELEGGIIKAGDPAFFFEPFPYNKNKPEFRWAGDAKENAKRGYREDEYDEDWPVYHSVEEFEDAHQGQEDLDEATLGVHPLGYVYSSEAEQDYKALMKQMPEGPRKLKHKKKSLFEGAGYVTRNGNTVDSDKIDRDRVDKGQIRYNMSGGLLKLEVGKRPSASQVAKLRQLIGKADSVDLDVYSDSHKDFEHYKKDRLDQVIAAISWFFDTNRLPPFQGLAPLRTDVERLDQG